MSETQFTNNEDKKEMSSEEIKAYRKAMIDYYKEQLPLVKLQSEYETLLADIEEARARRVTMTMRIAQMMAPPEEEQQESQESLPSEPTPAPVEKKERKLKTE